VDKKVKKILVVLPALNEERTIGEVLDRISQLEIKNYSISALVVNDGSNDSTKAIAVDKGVQVVTHGQNRGVGAAFQSGVKEAITQGVDILVNIDSDGQFDPKHIPSLLEPIITEKVDFVTASRFLNDRKIDMPIIKRWGNRQIAKIVSRLSDQKIHDVSCGFRAYARKAFLHLSLIGNFTYTHEVILTLAFKGFVIKEVYVPVRGTREFGESRVASSLFKYAFHAMAIIIRCYRDYNPIMAFGLPGIIMTSVGLLLFTIFFICSFIQGEWIPKSAAFTGAFSITAGMVLFVIALIADMFTRIRVKIERVIELVDNEISRSETNNRLNKKKQD
jgi:glycosyltransferase involved in cell wall biosynthesis